MQLHHFSFHSNFALALVLARDDDDDDDDKYTSTNVSANHQQQ